MICIDYYSKNCNACILWQVHWNGAMPEIKVGENPSPKSDVYITVQQLFLSFYSIKKLIKKAKN